MPLRILLLGPPQILDGTAPPPAIKNLRRRERVALYFLAASPQPIPRYRLLHYLWGPDADPHRAGKSLSATLSRLQKVLPAGAFQRQDKTYALVDHPDVFIDYRHFRRVCERRLPLAARIPVEQHLPLHLVQALKEAEHLWRGTFLEGCSTSLSAEMDNWLTTTTEHLTTCYRNILNRLAQHTFLQEEYAETFRLAKLSLQQQPDQVEMLLLALKALQRQRLFAQAQAFLERQRAAYQEYTALDLAPEVLAEAQCLTQPLRAHRQSPVPWQPHPTLNAPFIGHESLIADLVRQAQQGGGHLILGPSGQGKTRLLQELAARLHTTHRLLSITCHHGESNLPFAPLLEAFRREIQPEEWERVPPEWQPYLAHLFPEARRYLSYPIPPAPTPLQQHLMEATRQLLLVITENQPLTVCIDDAHWSDPATADTLVYWLERPPFAPSNRHHPAFMLLTARSETLRESPLGQQLLPLYHENHIAATELPGLSKEQTAKLAAAMLGRPLTPEEADHLWRASVAGTPLYTLELLRYQIESGQSEAPVHSWPLSRRLTHFIAQRLHYLTEDARMVLEYVMLQESGASLHLLAQATGLPHDRLVHALEMLEDTHWLQPINREGTPVYRLMHTKLAEALQADLSTARRQHIHLRLAKAGETLWQDNLRPHAAILAYHYQKAGEARRAFHYWIEAAHHALSLAIAFQAHHAFRQAAQLAAAHPDLFSDLEIWRLFAEWSLLAADTVDTATLDHITHRLQTLAEQRESFLLRSSQLNAHAHLYRLQDRFDDALLMLQQAFDWLARAPDTTWPRLELHTHYSLIASVRQQIHESWEHLVQGFKLARDLSDPLVYLYLGNLHYQRALSLIFTARPDLADQEATRSLEAFQTSQRVFGVADALAARSIARFLLGNFNAALEDCRLAREHGERFHKKRLLAYTYSYCALSQIALGKLVEAWQSTQRSLELSEHYHNVQGSVLALRARGDLFFTLEDWENAHAHYTEALLYSQQYTLEADLRFRVGETLARLGRVDEGLAMVRKGIALQERLADRPLPITRLAEADILILANRLDEALRLLHATRGHVVSQPGIDGNICLLESRIYRRQHRRAEAIAAARCAVEKHTNIGHYFFRRWGLEILQSLDALTPGEARSLQQIYRQLAGYQHHPAFGASICRLLNARSPSLC